MHGMKYRLTFISFIFILTVSCSQKYDDIGVFEPDNPDFFAVNVTSITEEDTLVISKDRIKDGYIYFGRDGEQEDFLAWAEPILKLPLPSIYGLDSVIVTYRLFENPLSGNDSLEVFRIQEDWSYEYSDYSSIVTHAAIDTVTIDTITSALSFKITKNMIREWFTEEGSVEAGFHITPLEGNNISPIIKFYSSRWESDSQKPIMTSFYTFTDSLTAEDGISDSTLYVTNQSFVSDDMTFAGKKALCEVSDAGWIKLGGISGESYLCRIPLDGIPTNAVVLSGKIDLTATAEEDSLYGNISNIVLKNRELLVYIVQDAMWYTDESFPNIDSTFHVYEYKINLSDSINSLTMDIPIQNWIKDPSSNHGFLITTKNWGNPFGFSIFEKPKFTINYITNSKDR